MKNNKCVIVIPLYKSVLKQYEIDSIDSAKRNFNVDDIFIITPDDLIIDLPIVKNLKRKNYNKKFFESVDGYNELCFSKKFYQDFIDLGYDYMLIHQLDSYTFSNKLDYFMNMNYDWYGANVGLKNRKKSKWYGVNVGNGGYSLRKLSKMVELTDKYCNREIPDISEDCFFCSVLRDEIKTCTEKIADEFSVIEHIPRVLPMGIHGSSVKNEKYKVKTKTETAKKKRTWPEETIKSHPTMITITKRTVSKSKIKLFKKTGKSLGGGLRW